VSISELSLCRFLKRARTVRFHVGAQDGVDTSLVSALAEEPAEQVGIKAHGDDFFRGGQDDFGGLPELRKETNVSDFYGALESTSFHVKDRAAFLADPDVVKIQEHAKSEGGFFDEEKNTPGEFAFGWYGQYRGTVLRLYNEEALDGDLAEYDEEAEELDVCAVIQRHIVDGEICQIGISGNEKLIYIGGSIHWVSSKGTAYFDGQTSRGDTVDKKRLLDSLGGLLVQVREL
jgi:hypothetical protein